MFSTGMPLYLNKVFKSFGAVPVILIMKTFLTILAIIAVATAHFNPGHELEERSHEGIFMNELCCRQYGGVPCGLISKTCCLGRCNNFGITQICSGQNLPLRASMCSNSCLNQCRSQGGILCGTSFFSNSCCAPQYCTGLTSLTRTCAPGTAIPLRGCYTRALFG